MKLRWKVLLLLLGIALLPLVLVRLSTVWSLRGLGDRVSQGLSGYLVREAEKELRQVVSIHAHTVDSERRYVELMLREQAREVTRRLAQAPPDNPPPVYAPDDFAGGRAPGIRASAHHAQLTDNGARADMPVSYEAQVIHVQPGVDRESVRDDIARLADMTGVYRQLSESARDLPLWQFTSLETGVHSSFPGKGGYNANWDPRQRSYYERAVAQPHAVCWTALRSDDTTRRPVITATMSVHRPDGSIAGVTGVDVPIRRIFGPSAMSSVWASQARLMIISLEDRQSLRDDGIEVPEGAGKAALVVAEHPDLESDWDAVGLLRVLGGAEMPEAARLVAAMRQEGEGLINLTHHGRDSLCAFGPVNPDQHHYLAVIVPRDEVLRMSSEAEARVNDEMWLQVHASGVAVFVVAVAVIIIALRASLKVARPVARLSAAAREVADGNLDARMPALRGRDELAEMTDAFNTMVPKLRDRVRLRESLNLAMEVQQSLLPDAPPRVPGLDVAGHSDYCDETGGDYYDFLDYETLGERRLGVVIGDVVGHGVAAALLMATARALLRSRTSMSSSLCEVLEHVNHHLQSSRFSGRFMTAYFMLIDVSARTIHWVSAGHDPAIVYDPSTDQFDELAGNGIPLGIETEWRYEQFERQGWHDGQVIVLGTDGIWECRNPAGEMFGKDRLREIIRQHADQPAQTIIDAVQSAVHNFRADDQQQDDITMVVIRMVGCGAAPDAASRHEGDSGDA